MLKQIGIVDPIILQALDSITRSTSTLIPEQRKLLAKLLRENNLDLSVLVQNTITNNKTGWKEIVGNITKITGHPLLNLGVTDKAVVDQLQGFCANEGSPSSVTLWEQELRA